MIRRKPFLATVFFSLLGAAAIHVALVACSTRTTVTTGGPGSARADTPTPSCSSWMVATYVQKGVVPGDGGKVVGTQTIPDGWEPYGASVAGSFAQSLDVAHAIRKCAQ